MAVAVSAIKEEIEKAKENLKNVDENIKKITGRDPNEPRPGAVDGRRVSAGGQRGKEFGEVLGRHTREFRDKEQAKDSEPPRKRVAVFSRLGGPLGGGRRVILTGRRASKQEEPEEDEDEEGASKPAVQSSVVSTAKKITKSELISAQNVGEKGKARNRRMFGMLLGTLAKFADNQGRQTKQALKQKEVETRLEEETAEERKKLASERRTLFNERRAQQKRIQLLEMKVALADELVQWEKEWEKKSKFIMTKTSPSIYFMPTEFTPRTQRALQDSKERIDALVKKHKKSVGETMNAYDDEIKILDGKQDNEDGKRGGNEEGRRCKIMGLSAEPEEAMDLDSMEPQVDIKVDVDDGDVVPTDNGVEKDEGVRVVDGVLGQNPSEETRGDGVAKADHKEDVETGAMEEVSGTPVEDVPLKTESMEQDITKDEESHEKEEKPFSDFQGEPVENIIIKEVEQGNSSFPVQSKMEEDGKADDSKVQEDKVSEPQLFTVTLDSPKDAANFARSKEGNQKAEVADTEKVKQNVVMGKLTKSPESDARGLATTSRDGKPRAESENGQGVVAEQSKKSKLQAARKRSHLSPEKFRDEKKNKHHAQRTVMKRKTVESSTSSESEHDAKEDTRKKPRKSSSDGTSSSDWPSRSKKKQPSSRSLRSVEKKTIRRKPESTESSSSNDDDSSSSSEDEQKKRTSKSQNVDDRSLRHSKGDEYSRRRPQHRSRSKNRERDSSRRDRHRR